MMRRNVKLTTLVLILSVIVYSCSSDDSETEFGDNATLKFSQDEINTDFEEFVDTLEINSDSPWEIVLPQTSDWIEFSQMEGGSGTKNILVSVGKNLSSEDREVEVGFKTDFFTYPVTIIQGGNTSLELSETEIERSFQSFVDSIKVSSVDPWHVNEIPDWIELSPIEGDGDKMVIISGTENESEEKRSSTLIFQSGSLSKSLVISQEPFSRPFEIKREGSFLDLSSEGMEDRFTIPKDFGRNLFMAGQSFSISLKMKEIPEYTTGLPRILYRNDGNDSMELIRNRRENDGQLYWLVTDENGNDLGSAGGTETLVNDREWHHVVLVVDTQKKESYIYVDGNKEAIKSHTSDDYGSLNMDADWIIGDFSLTRPKGSNWNYGGFIDDLRFWNKALTKNEVVRDARNEISEENNNLVAGWIFDEAQGDVVYDSSGEFKGTLIGEAKVSNNEND